MLWLRRLEMKGFGPFAERQVLEFPDSKGVTVVYGENMRGKTSLLNAIRYAFFGKVLSRGSRERRLHTISNRELGEKGIFGFTVSLHFEFDGQEYELVRECLPRVKRPESDDDYDETVMLKRGRSPLGPQERERALQQIFPNEISRFFLFDGELLQEYEELLYNDSDTGPKISGAIERILGVPILRRAKIHLTRLGAEADRDEAKEALKIKGTEALGIALQQATEQKEQHHREIARLQKQLDLQNTRKVEIEQALHASRKYSGLMEERDSVSSSLEVAKRDEKTYQADLQKAMSEAWRSLLRDPVKEARAAAQAEAQKDFEALVLRLRAQAVDKGRCGTCEQELSEKLRARLKKSLPAKQTALVGSPAMSRLADLGKFTEADNTGEVRQMWKRLKDLRLEQVALEDRLSGLNSQLSESDPDTIRRNKSSYTDVLDKILSIKNALAEENKRAEEKERNAQRCREKLEAMGATDLRASQLKAKTLREAAGVFHAAIERYKSDLRMRVEATASKLFKAMTTEKQDYAGLAINESYGLTILHRAGSPEEGRSAGAEHVGSEAHVLHWVGHHALPLAGRQERAQQVHGETLGPQERGHDGLQAANSARGACRARPARCGARAGAPTRRSARGSRIRSATRSAGRWRPCGAPSTPRRPPGRACRR